ncbi:MAG TPA: hybrid sensor histidine kinase/response regulator, partial [Spirochaetia bacterium]|nr:hybrid sensor histidine kinase/response regulator [Spirochaetia bacterium]
MKSMEAFKGRIRILIVDDEKSILQLYVNMLHPGHLSGSVDFEPPSYSPPANSNGNNLDVTLCSTYREAVTTIEQSRTDPFSLAFLDVHLGRDDDNGIDLAGKIRQIDKEIEIVLVTGDSNIDMFRISREIPPKDKLFYLNKPFKTLEIRQFVESLSAKWRTEKELHEMKDNLADLVDERTRELSESNSKLRTEIEAKQRIAESLRVSEDNFKRMIEENADPIIIVDARGRVQY